MEAFQIEEGTKALRDFFSAATGEEIKSAAIAISRQFDISLSGGEDWTEVEYDFNRLFVGPMAVPAPPYASAYLEEPTLMGRPAMEVRKVYRTLGLAVPDQGATPDDHLAFELDATLALEAALEASMDTAAADEVRAMKAWFISEHMGGWVPRFTASIKEQEGVSGPIAMAAVALSRWLDGACSQSGSNDS